MKFNWFKLLQRPRLPWAGQGDSVSPSPMVQPGVPVASVAPAQPDSNLMAARYFSKDPQTPFSILDRHHHGVPLGTLMGIILLLGGGYGAYYNLIVVNQPEHIWQTAVSNTGKAYDKVVKYGVSDVQGGTIKGTYKLEGNINIDGSLDMQFYQNNANFTFDIGAPPTRATIIGRLIDSEYSDSPDVYFRATGLHNLSTVAPDYAAALGAYDNQWLVVDHTLLDGYRNKFIKSQNANSQLGPAEISKITTTVGKVNKDYLFTNNQSKAVFQVTQNIGKEEQGKRTVYHYKVKLDKQHTKDYINAMASALQTTPAANIASSKQIRDAIDFDGLIDKLDSFNDSSTAEVYVDVNTKLIRTIRFTDKLNAQNYLDLGFQQEDRDHLPFVIKLHNNKDGKVSDMNLTISLNTKTKITDIDLMTNSVPTGSKGQKFSAKLTLAPSSTVLVVKKPVDINSLLDVAKPASGKSVGDLFGTFTISVTPGTGDTGSDDIVPGGIDENGDVPVGDGDTEVPVDDGGGDTTPPVDDGGGDTTPPVDDGGSETVPIDENCDPEIDEC